MAEQESLLPGPPADGGGIWRRYLTAGQIHHAAWLRARSEGAPVGDCRRCDQRLYPEAPTERAGGTDYEATCPGCGYVLLAPRGRTMHGSTLWSKSNGAARAAAIHRHAKEGTDA